MRFFFATCVALAGFVAAASTANAQLHGLHWHGPGILKGGDDDRGITGGGSLYYGSPYYGGYYGSYGVWPYGYNTATYPYYTGYGGYGGYYGSPYYGYGYSYPGAYYRPGYFVWFNN